MKSPERGQVTYWDTLMPAFGLRVSQGGTKTWVVMSGAKRRRVTLGRYPDVSLKDARAQAAQVLKEMGESSETGEKISFNNALNLFLTTHCAVNNKASTAKETERLLRNHFQSSLDGVALADISIQDFTAIIDQTLETPSEAKHAFTAGKTFFAWAVRRRYVDRSPAEGLLPPSKPNSRDRVPTDEEIKKIYLAATEIGYPFGFIVLVAIHTAMRRSEISHLRWSWITPEAITLPSHITKNGREHTLPNLIGKNLALIPKTSELLFPSAEDTPYSAWSKGKKKLDTLSGVTDFVLHDTRRYVSTTMAKLRVPVDITEAILNHVSGSRSPIQRVYDKHDRHPEMREALLLYEQHIARIIM